MPKKSLQDTLIDGLKTLGAKEIKHSSTKYRAFQKEGWGTYFVGRAGALRVSRTGKMTDSTPVLPSFRKQVLERGRAKNEKGKA